MGANAPTDVDVTDVMYECKSTAEEKGDIGRATEAPVFAWFRLTQATSAIEVTGHGKFGVSDKLFEANAPVGLVHFVTNKATGNFAW